MGHEWSGWMKEWMVYPPVLSYLVHWGTLFTHWFPASAEESLLKVHQEEDSPACLDLVLKSRTFGPTCQGRHRNEEL